jgi:hypothetical protein
MTSDIMKADAAQPEAEARFSCSTTGLIRLRQGCAPVCGSSTAGQAGDAPVAGQMLALLAPGAILIADRAYDTNAIRAACAERGAWVNIPPRIIRKGTFAFSGFLYRQRSLVERFWA